MFILRRFIRNQSSLAGLRGGSAQEHNRLTHTRNIGVSAHIDSGKTTTTERILYYTGRISEIHDVRGKDGVGAKMDHMELEREKGITITSACTFTNWKRGDLNYHLNIIDTPGHIDFSVEVERALRVLDGAIMICCGVGGVQSQTVTVDRQMRRYRIPRLVFINKMDRYGADPDAVLAQIRKRFSFKSAAIQIPLGAEDAFNGICNVVDKKVETYDGEKGSERRISEVPDHLVALVAKKRDELMEVLSEVDDEFADRYFESMEGGSPIEAQEIHDAIRRATLSLEFAPLLIGSSFKNKGVQPLLDAVCLYLPSPYEKENVGYVPTDTGGLGEEVRLECASTLPLVAFAFKIQDLPGVGCVTFLRIYQGKMAEKEGLFNMMTRKRQSTKRLCRTHSAELQSLESAGAGEIVAVTGLDCASGSTFTDGKTSVILQNMFIPEPVMSYSLEVTSKDDLTKFSRAVSRFEREDPTFHVHTDSETKEILASGMGELHLDVYIERMRREYGVLVKVGTPRVHYREYLSETVEVNYTHKKQTGGRGQYGRVIGYFEPIDQEDDQKAVLDKLNNQKSSTGALRGDDKDSDAKYCLDFVNKLVGQGIPPSLITSVEKGFRQTALKGRLSGNPLINTRFVLSDGASHEVDSSDLAFRQAIEGALSQAYESGSAHILEPIMNVEVLAPAESQTVVVQSIIGRKGAIDSVEVLGDSIKLSCSVPLRNMFAYTAELRGATAGMGEFCMTFNEYVPMPEADARVLEEEYTREKQARK